MTAPKGEVMPKSKRERKASAEPIRVRVPAWAKQAEAASKARGEETDIAHAAAVAHIILEEARKQGAHRIASCLPLMQKAREALNKARDGKRSLRVRERLAERAGDLFAEAWKRAKRTRAFPPLQEVQGMVLPLGYSVSLDFIRQYRVANQIIYTRCQLFEEHASDVPLFEPTKPGKVLMYVVFPRDRRETLPPATRRKFAGIERALRKLGYTRPHTGHEGERWYDRHLQKNIANATEITLAAAEIDRILAPKPGRRATRSGSRA